jgi:hypothetical protein
MLFRVNKCKPRKVLWHPRGQTHEGHRCNVTRGLGLGAHFALARENSFGGAVPAVCGNGFGLADQMLRYLPAPSARGCGSLQHK